ncbi:hypothetical protein [Paracidovorax cattleyae]|uniref:Uncharacterized protein n=1 Tax=Paracidovorax cattleyae TaxID=80868 RepID=A0A1H0WUF6_9BURK|nr:hypothetical protein [Paracidovorax cattleyae]MBF9263944.1 hypothetical protein [Paracidovorax cattleyae]SDP94075.1 hypothetical protein SAMN04489708_1583 [Paracidovorax cattleyae]
MRDYWLTQSLLQAVGWGYVLAVVIALLLAGWAPRRGRAKVLAVFGVLLLASILPVKGYRQYREQQQIKQERKERYQKAKALFDERCKTAGEKIYRTVDNIEGVILLNVRDKNKDADRGDKFWPNAALPDEASGDWYIMTFLQWEHLSNVGAKRGYLNNEPSSYPGYEFVEVREGSIFIRYEFAEPGKSDSTALKKTLVEKATAKYSVSFVNIDDPEGRENWIAGTQVVVRDERDGSVLAQKTWYSFEPGLGSTAGSRSPWGFATTCPAINAWAGAPTRMFVDQILVPKKRG